MRDHPSASHLLCECLVVFLVYKKECFSALKCERKAKAKITAPHPLHADLEKAAADNLSKLVKTHFLIDVNTVFVLQNDSIREMSQVLHSAIESFIRRSSRSAINSQKSLAILTRSAIFNEIRRFDEIGHYIRRSSRSAINFTQEQSTLQTIKKLIKSILNSQIGARMH